MKRFWQQAAIASEHSGWQVLLDGKPVRLPGGGPLVMAHRPLAEAVAAEWQQAGGAPGGEMSYADVPFTRLAGTAQDRIVPDPEPVALELARYGESDLLCYRADQPQALALREQEEWQPWLDWAESRFGAHLRVTSGVVHVAQDPAALAALAAAVSSFDAWTLAGLGLAVPGTGSLVLGLAMASGELDPVAAHGLATLDEAFQEELWGPDQEARARRARIGAELALAGRYMALCRQRTS
jgi:chaperone required for assembly of F1-ATPase